MGLATAKIVGRDHFVVISDVRQEQLDVAVLELKNLGIDCAAAVCDVTQRQSVDQLVETSTGFGTVASVIHTAGVSPSMGSAELIMRINAVGTVNIDEAFYRIAGEGMAVVNVASMAAHIMPAFLVPTRRFKSALQDEDAFMKAMMRACGIVPEKARPGLAYSISKNFVTWYSASQAVRFGERGARIVSVSPGSFDTDMGRLEEQSGSGAMLRYAALRRFGRPDEIAELLAFCASEKAGYLTGVDILCDGGVVASMTLRDKLAVARDPR
jgi:NAD(P)-dependent dehydrogenase (short-subunit alcohol dehydrogenase family)